VEGDFRNESWLQIREAQMQKTPYMLVIGDGGRIGSDSPRQRNGQNLGSIEVMPSSTLLGSV